MIAEKEQHQRIDVIKKSRKLRYCIIKAMKLRCIIQEIALYHQGNGGIMLLYLRPISDETLWKFYDQMRTAINENSCCACEA